MTLKTRRTPDLDVATNNQPGWYQASNRRHGFHNAHRMFRRAMSFRAGRQVVLQDTPDADLAARAEVALLIGRKETSAFVVAQGDRLLFSHHAPDFAINQTHSIQSISKMLMHLIAGRLIALGKLDPRLPVEHYLADIGSGFRGATVQDVLDMNVINHYSEDYDDPYADVYDEEMSMGWRLPPEGKSAPRPRDFINAITGDDLHNPTREIRYSSANTDVLTLICSDLCPGELTLMLGEIAEAAGFEDPFYMSYSLDGLPVLSGGGCLTATDLTRFGLLLARVGRSEDDMGVGESAFMQAALTRTTRHMPPPREHVRYSDHVMTNGRWIGHSGYGGQFLMVDLASGTVCTYLSVLENASAFSTEYMAETIAAMEALLPSAG